MTRRACEGRSTPATLLIGAVISLITLSSAHQSISLPTPISFDLACRVGLGRNCPGPCPTHLLRKDQTPNNPSVTVRRGGVLPVHILKNNHVGGFSRWSLVTVSDMYNKKKHAESAFLFTCADNLVTFCTKENQDRDCKVDRMNQYYRYFLRIPKVYPDGYYVLGWIWYGGAVSTGTHGAFGDYYDCVYVRINGGPIEDSYQPIFKPGQTMTGGDGMCRATTNRVGHCHREPCPFGNRQTRLMKPAEFERKQPTKILRKSFEKRTDKKEASSILQKGNLSSSDHKPRKPINKADSRPPSKPTPRPTSRPTKKPSNAVKPTVSTSPTPNQISVSPKSATGSSFKLNPKPTSKATSNQNSKSTSKLAKHTSKPMSAFDNKSSSGSANSGSAQEGKERRHFKEQTPKEDRDPEPLATPAPTTTPNSSRENAKKIAKQQRQREKKLRQKAKMRERREKQLRKAEEKNAKLEAKRLRRKKIKEERAIKKEKQRQEKQRKKQEQRARKLAKKEAKRAAKRAAKRRSKRSFARPQQEEDGREYDDCFEEGIFPRDDGHIDYGDPVADLPSGN